MKKFIVNFFIGAIAFMPLAALAQDDSTQLADLNPLGTADPRVLIARIILGVLSISGSIALLMFVYGGILWLTSMGRPDPVQKGKQILIWATLGIAVIASAYVIVDAIFNAVTTGNVNPI